MSSPFPPGPDPYQTLGVKQDADLAAIRSAHRKLTLKHHPDRIHDQALKSKAGDIFQEIQQAYELLSDPRRRSRYDELVRPTASRKEPITRDRLPSKTKPQTMPTRRSASGGAGAPKRLSHVNHPGIYNSGYSSSSSLDSSDQREERPVRRTTRTRYHIVDPESEDERATRMPRVRVDDGYVSQRRPAAKRSRSVQSRASSRNSSLGVGRRWDREYQRPDFARGRAGSGSDVSLVFLCH